MRNTDVMDWLFTATESTGFPPAFVPVPAAVWLFGSGLPDLVDIARRKQAA
jgi:hypothetical protein